MIEESRFTVTQLGGPLLSFGSYRYRIDRNGKRFATFTHNYRGECERLKLKGRLFGEDPPFGMCDEFLTGGGPEPHGLTPAAVEYLQSLADGRR